MAPKVGVILLNLGTPDGTDYWSMRRYLAEFLSDKRVIDYSACSGSRCSSSSSSPSARSPRAPPTARSGTRPWTRARFGP
jgi:hypothetical protein